MGNGGSTFWIVLYPFRNAISLGFLNSFRISTHLHGQEHGSESAIKPRDL